MTLLTGARFWRSATASLRRNVKQRAQHLNIEKDAPGMLGADLEPDELRSVNLNGSNFNCERRIPLIILMLEGLSAINAMLLFHSTSHEDF